MIYRLALFDLDDTLAPSKGPVAPEMVDMIVALTRVLDVGVISGGRFEQFVEQLLKSIACPDALARLHVLPTCGTRYLVHDGSKWCEVYSEPLTDDEVQQAVNSLQQRALELELWEPNTWGPRIELRGSQVTFSALGQQAPIAAKRAWDRTGVKRKQLRRAVAADLPGLEVRSGGSTSIDITRQGIDKAYGVTRLLAHLGVPPTDAIFFGDRLDPGGNDYPVISTGVHCVAVEDWNDTPTKVRQHIPDPFD